MKLASFVGSKRGFNNIGHLLIRFRLEGDVSHSEIMFEPGDGVDHLMPDKTTQPTEDGAYWHISSVGLERLPSWSRRRPGKIGGLRFKRIIPNSADYWYVPLYNDPISVATMAVEKEGSLYDWQSILKNIIWLIPSKTGRGMCSESLAELLGYKHPEKFDPWLLHIVSERIHEEFTRIKGYNKS